GAIAIALLIRLALGARALAERCVTLLATGFAAALGWVTALCKRPIAITPEGLVALETRLARKTGLAALARRVTAGAGATRLGSALARKFLAIVVHVAFAFPGAVEHVAVKWNHLASHTYGKINSLDHDVVRKPLHTFRHHGLAP